MGVVDTRKVRNVHIRSVPQLPSAIHDAANGIVRCDPFPNGSGMHHHLGTVGSAMNGMQVLGIISCMLVVPHAIKPCQFFARQLLELNWP